MDIKIDLFNFTIILSLALDLADVRVFNHHIKVAYITLELAELLDRTQDKTELFLGAILHDIGISSSQAKLEAHRFEFDDYWAHCLEGYRLAQRFALFHNIAPYILYHHQRWNEGQRSYPYPEEYRPSYNLIHLADRVAVQINPYGDILAHKKGIVAKIKDFSGSFFNPEFVEAFLEISQIDSFWFNLTETFLPGVLLKKTSVYERTIIQLEGLKDMAGLFSHIIDRKSPYTYRHSNTVARVALTLGKRFSLSPLELQYLEIAALLHDLGKLSLPDQVLDKPAKLSEEEFSLIKRHTYYTYHILDQLGGIEDIRDWAAFHHEKLDGSGYPFGRDEEDLPLCAKIMAISDIFSALTEDRPYRKSLTREEAFQIMDNMVKNRAIDGTILEVMKGIGSELDPSGDQQPSL